MKKLLLFTVIASIASYSFSISYGGSAEILGKAYKNTDKELEKYAEGTLSGHLKIPFTKDNLQYLSVEGSVTEKLTDYADADFDNYATADVSLFKYSGIFNLNKTDKIVLSAGRFMVSDVTGIILGQTNDGVMMQLLKQRINATAYGGWTGLLNAQNVTVLDCKKSDFAYDSKKMYDYASSYAIGELSLSLPYLYLNQTVSAEALCLLGTKGLNSDNSDYYRAYFTLAQNGPLRSNVFYNTYASLCLDKDTDDPGMIAKVKADWYPGYKSSSVSVSALYASGEQGPFTAFKGITSSTAASSYDEPEYSAMIKTGLAGSVKPTDNIIVTAGADLVMACPEKEIEYDGFQYNAGFKIQPFTDLSVNTNFTQFIGDDKTKNKAMLTLSTVMSF